MFSKKKSKLINCYITPWFRYYTEWWIHHKECRQLVFVRYLESWMLVLCSHTNQYVSKKRRIPTNLRHSQCLVSESCWTKWLISCYFDIFYQDLTLNEYRILRNIHIVRILLFSCVSVYIGFNQNCVTLFSWSVPGRGFIPYFIYF